MFFFLQLLHIICLHPGMVFSPLPPLIPPLSLMEDLPPSLLAANNVTRALA